MSGIYGLYLLCQFIATLAVALFVDVKDMAPVLDRGQLSRVLYINNKQSRRSEVGVVLDRRRFETGPCPVVKSSLGQSPEEFNRVFVPFEIFNGINREYRQYRLLTAEEEGIMGKICNIAKRIKLVEGKLSERLNRTPSVVELADACAITVPRLESYRSLALLARNRLVKHNTGLVDFWLRGILEHSKSTKDISYLELITEGLVGLIKATENYDGRARFSTYSQPYIRDYIYRGISKLKSGAVSSHRSNMLANRIKKMEYEYRTTVGRAPTDDEIAAALYTGLAGVEAVREDVRRRLVSPSNMPSSWMTSNANTNLVETVESFFDLYLLSQPDFSQESLLWKIDFNAALECLSPPERRALGLRYGYIDGTMHSSKETAQLMKMTDEGLRKLFNRSFEKLRRTHLVWKDAPSRQSSSNTY